LNILQLCKYYPPVLGGIELVEKTISKAHSELNDNLTIVAFSDSANEASGEFSEKIYLIKQDVFFKSAPLNLKFIFKFRKIIEKHNIERIYVHLPNPFMHEVLKYSRNYLKKKKIEVIAVYHSDIVNQKMLGKLYNFYFSLNLNIYDRWICSSDNLWSSSAILKNLPERKKEIIPFCTEGNLIFKKREVFNGQLLAVGRLVPYKGFEFLINTINKTNYQLHIIGDGPEFLKLQKIAGKNIVLHRNIDDVKKKKLFDDCDLLIVSSINRAEAYGMIIVEAFEAGMPVVASNLKSGVTYLVQHEQTGLVFETKNEDQLINSIKRLENDSDLYKKISGNTRNFFDQNLSFSHFKTKIENLGRNINE
jgi:glycosyltransferase involved in cell wall biosynthesis